MNERVESKKALRSRVRAWLQLLNQPASPRLVWVLLAITWFGAFILWHADFRNYLFVCDHDAGANLHSDEVISTGALPGTDFFYAYGLLSLLVPHLFFAAFGHSPAVLLLFITLCSICSYVGLGWTLTQFKPTRLGATLLAGAAAHTTWVVTPMYAMEATMLIWAVALRLRGHSSWAIIVATATLFVKMSMASVLVAELLGLAVVDAIRARRARALAPLLAAPATFAICATIVVTRFDFRALVASFNPTFGAAMYRAYNLGFFREGRLLWHPSGHTIFWYIGGIPGPWLLATGVLVVLAMLGAIRLIRACITTSGRGAPLIRAEAATISGFANLAYIFGFYPQALNGTFYYAWLLLVGLAPLLGRARLHLERGVPRRRAWGNYGWALLALLLVSSQSIAVRQFVRFIAERRVKIGDVTTTPAVADDITTALRLGHSTGGGVITAVARASNFGLIDSTIRQGHHWQMLNGIPPLKTVDEMLQLASTSDILFVPAYDYSDLLKIDELGPFLQSRERVYEGSHILLLRAQQSASKPR